MPKIIEVVPNPYIALDHEGVPQGVVSAGMPGVFIGAQQDLHASRATGKMRFYYPLDREGKATKKVVLSGDVITAVHAGELIAANLPSALACGLTAKEFLEPEKALAAERKKALDYFQALRSVDGKPNLEAKLAEIPRKPTEESDGAPIKTASETVAPNLKMTKVEV